MSREKIKEFEMNFKGVSTSELRRVEEDLEKVSYMIVGGEVVDTWRLIEHLRRKIRCELYSRKSKKDSGNSVKLGLNKTKIIRLKNNT